MRQTEITGSLPLPAGRPNRRPVFFQDCCDLAATCGDGVVCTVSLQRQSVRINRPVGGSICGINVKAGEFDGVAVVADNGALTVRLMRADFSSARSAISASGAIISQQFQLCAVSFQPSDSTFAYPDSGSQILNHPH